MQLTSIRVENYKIIEDSGEVHLDPVTCLVGKNESGKSTLLQALYKFNPVESDIIYHDLQDYPRRLLADYEDIKHEHVANVMTTRWTLQDKELKELKELLGPDGFSEQMVVVKKGYDNQRKWDFAVNEKAVAAYYLSRSGIEAAEKKELEDSESVEKLLERLKALEKPGKKQQALQERLEKAFPTTVRNAAERILESHLPVFLYFSNYQRMPGQVAMNELLEKQKTKGLAFSDKIFLALLSLAGVTAEGIQELGFFEQMIAKLEAVSNRLSKEIFSFWSQNQHLEVEFRYDAARPNDFYPYNEGYIFRTRIRNRRYGVTVNFEERSNGFV